MLLCFSLFASLIHAAVMPLDHQSGYLSHEMASLQVSADHACDQETNHAQTMDTAQLCHGDGYQCCLGLVLTPEINVDLQTSFLATLIPRYSSLVMQPMTHFIFKPPKV